MALVATVIVLVLGTALPSSADVNDFRFESFDAQYHLSRDAEGHSLLKTVETLVAVFPETDQNHGIRRSLVESYDGHPTDLRIVSVTDERGVPRDYETDSDDGFLDVTIAAKGYVHGEQSYVITYTQRNVTKHYADTDADEFYWDVNGTGWAQHFDRVSATVHLGDGLRSRLTGGVTAVYGPAGSSTPADTEHDGDTLRFAAADLGPGENLTFAIGFETGTFTPRDDGFFAAPWPALSGAFALLSLALVGGALSFRRRRLRDAPGRGIIVPEYLPPKGVSVLLSSVVLQRTAKAMPAQVLSLAVAGNLRILEVEGRRSHYRLEFRSAEGAGPDEREFLSALFGADPEPGAVRDLGKPDTGAARRISALMKRVTASAVADGYRRRVSGRAPWVLASLVSGGLAFAFGLIAVEEVYGDGWPGLAIAVGVVAFIAVCILVARIPLDARGVELRDYLKGLEVYIKLAEADRLRYLQSPEGALRAPVESAAAAGDRVQLVRLNERLLGYAALFGLEKRWAEELGRLYEELGTQPSWYAGSAAFNAAVFANGIGAVSLSSSASFSSSGGSAGGASSGGGGGGGGGSGV